MIKNQKMIGNLLLTLTALIWGMAFVFQRKGMESIEPITFTSARMALAAVAVGIAAFIYTKKPVAKTVPAETEKISAETERKNRRKNTVLGGICCGAFLACASIFQQMGIVYTTAGKAGFITAMYMIIVPVIGFVLFKKRNTWIVWLAVLIGVAGMYLLCITEGFTLTRGDTLVCICAVLFSGHILCCDYFVQRGEPIWISAIQFVTCSALSAVAACILETPTWEKVVSAAIPILYCGILSGGVGYTLQIIAQKFTDPTIASLLMSLESVFAVLAGAILLHERMTPREMAGCAVMFIAILLVQIPLPDRSVRELV